MDILQTSMEFPPYMGGGGTYVNHLAGELACAGLNITVLTSGEEDITEQHGPVEVIRRRSYYDSLQSGAMSPRAVQDTKEAIEATDPDVLHAHHTVPILIAKTLDEWSPTPTVYTQHRTPEQPGEGLKLDGKGLMSELAFKAPGYGTWIAPSHFFENRIAASGIPRENIQAIWPSLTYDRFTPTDRTEARQKLSQTLTYDETLPLVVIPTVDRPRKDIGFSLEALSTIENKLQVVITGVNQDSPRYEQLTEEYPMLQLIPHDRLDDETMHTLYNAADVVTLSSRREGFGLAALEAAACGGNVCLRSAPGHNEIASQLPWLPTAETVEELAQNITNAIEDIPSYAEKIRRHEMVREAFSNQSQIEQHIRAYSDIMQTVFRAVGLPTRTDGTLATVDWQPQAVRLKPHEDWTQAANRSIREVGGILPTTDGRLIDERQAQLATGGKEYTRVYAFDAD